MKILVIEDEPDIRELIRYNLERDQYTVLEASTGEAGLKLAKQENPELIMLDIMLPGMDGFKTCSLLKEEGSVTASIPILFLTAKHTDHDIVVGFELGAEDYIVKPFSPNVLLARIKKILKNTAISSQDKAEEKTRAYHGLTLYLDRYEAYLNDRHVPLTLSEFRALELLLSKPGWVFSRAQILEATKGLDSDVMDRTVDVLMVKLRKKLMPKSDLLETVRGVGYRVKRKK